MKSLFKSIVSLVLIAALLCGLAITSFAAGKLDEPGMGNVIVGEIHVPAFRNDLIYKAVAYAAEYGMESTDVLYCVTMGDEADLGIYNLTTAWATPSNTAAAGGKAAHFEGDFDYLMEKWEAVKYYIDTTTKELVPYGDNELPEPNTGGGPSVEAVATAGDWDGTTWTIAWADLNPQAQAQDITTADVPDGVTLTLGDDWKVAHIAGTYDNTLLIVSADKTKIEVKNTLSAAAPFEVAAKLVNGDKVAYIGIVVENRAPDTLTTASFTGTPAAYEVPAYGATIEEGTTVTIPDGGTLTVTDGRAFTVKGTLVVSDKATYTGKILGQDYGTFVGTKGFTIAGTVTDGKLSSTLTINEYVAEMVAGEYITLDANDSLVIGAMADDAVLNVRVTDLAQKTAIFADATKVEAGAKVMVQFFGEDAVEAKDAIASALFGTTVTGLGATAEWAEAVMGADGWEVDDSVGHPKRGEKAITIADLGTAAVDETAHKVTAVPVGTTVGALKAAITVSKDATFAILSGTTPAEDTADVTNTMIIKVTAEDGTTQDYAIELYAAGKTAALDGNSATVAGVLLGTFGTQSGKGETTAKVANVSILDSKAKTAKFEFSNPDKAVITAYADDGTGSGTYAAPLAEGYDFSGLTNTLWVKVVSEDKSATTFYKIIVNVGDKSNVNTLGLTLNGLFANVYTLEGNTFTVAKTATTQKQADAILAAVDVNPFTGGAASVGAQIKIVASSGLAAIIDAETFAAAAAVTGTTDVAATQTSHSIVVLAENGTVNTYAITLAADASTANTLVDNKLSIGQSEITVTPGTSSATFANATNGSANITNSQAAAAAGEFTVFARVPVAATSKIVKVASTAPLANEEAFNAAPAYTGGSAIATGDILYILITSESEVKNYYKITVTITPDTQATIASTRAAKGTNTITVTLGDGTFATTAFGPQPAAAAFTATNGTDTTNGAAAPSLTGATYTVDDLTGKTATITLASPIALEATKQFNILPTQAAMEPDVKAPLAEDVNRVVTVVAAETDKAITTLTVGGATATTGTASDADKFAVTTPGTATLTAAQGVAGGVSIAVSPYATSKVVKVSGSIASKYTEAAFNAAAPYLSGKIENGDVLFIKVTAEDGKYNFYKIVLTVSGIPVQTDVVKTQQIKVGNDTLTITLKNGAKFDLNKTPAALITMVATSPANAVAVNSVSFDGNTTAVVKLDPAASVEEDVTVTLDKSLFVYSATKIAVADDVEFEFSTAIKDVTPVDITGSSTTAIVLTLADGEFAEQLDCEDFGTTLTTFEIVAVTRVSDTVAIVWSDDAESGNGTLTVKASALARQATSVSADESDVAYPDDALTAYFTAAQDDDTITLTMSGGDEDDWSTDATNYVVVDEDGNFLDVDSATEDGVLTMDAPLATGNYVIIAIPATAPGTGNLVAVSRTSMKDVTSGTIVYGDATELIVTLIGGTFNAELETTDFDTTGLDTFTITAVTRVSDTVAIVWSGSGAAATTNGKLTVKGSAMAKQATGVYVTTDTNALLAPGAQLEASFTAQDGLTEIRLERSGASSWDDTAANYILVAVNGTMINPNTAASTGVLTFSSALPAGKYIIIAKAADTAGDGDLTATPMSDVVTSEISHASATALIVTLTAGTFEDTLTTEDFVVADITTFAVAGVTRVSDTIAIVWSSAAATAGDSAKLTVKGSAQATQASSVAVVTSTADISAISGALAVKFTATNGNNTITLGRTGAGTDWSTTTTDYILILASDGTATNPTGATAAGVLTVAAMSAADYIIVAKPATTPGSGDLTATLSTAG